MADSLPQFEITDQVGTSEIYSGSVNATGTNIPAVAGDPIDCFAIRCTPDQPQATRLQFSYDGGSNWITLRVSESAEWELRGYITQIKIRSAGTLATAMYEIMMNRGPK